MERTMISYSAKDLCTRSCMQIKLFTDHPEKRPSPNTNVGMGETFQHTFAKTLKGLIGEEMRGTYIKDGICINFSNDIVTSDKIIEVKSVSKDRPLEAWYLESSLLQCAVYQSLLKKSDRKLITAKFFADKGNPIVETTVQPNIVYMLKFGEETYSVKVNNEDEIVGFIMDKARHCEDWSDARDFDFQYKHKEFETLKKYFSYEKYE